MWLEINRYTFFYDVYPTYIRMYEKFCESFIMLAPKQQDRRERKGLNKRKRDEVHLKGKGQINLKKISHPFRGCHTWRI